MSKNTPIVRKLQADATNQEVSVSGLLRTAKLIATKLELEDALVWIDRELDGYAGMPVDDLPQYRQHVGVVKALNPYHGWQSVLFESPDTARAYSRAPVVMPIGVIEEQIRRGSNGEGFFVFNHVPEIKAKLVKALEYPTDVQVQLGYGAVYGIIEAVRNLILNWSLELEKAGILGDDMEFSQEEKKEAAPITQQVFAQNIGVVGDVADQARVTSTQSADIEIEIDLDAVADFANQARGALALLPDDTREMMEPAINGLEKELGKEKPDRGRLKRLLGSVKAMSIGAGGNLAAQGILSLLKNLI